MKRQRSHDADRRRGANRRRPVRRKVVALVLGVLVAVSAMLTAGVTTAAFTDTEWASAGDVIATGTHDLQFSGVSNTGPWTDAEPGAHVDIKLADAAKLVPNGAPITGQAWVKNTGHYYSSLEVELDVTGLSAGLLTWTVAEGDSAPVEPDANGVATLSAVPPGETVTVTFTLTLTVAGVNVQLPASVYLLATFTGTSIPNPGGM